MIPYLGVSPADGGGWEARVHVGGGAWVIGVFERQDTAARMRDLAVLSRDLGQPLNFDREDYAVLNVRGKSWEQVLQMFSLRGPTQKGMKRSREEALGPRARCELVARKRPRKMAVPDRSVM